MKSNNSGTDTISTFVTRIHFIIQMAVYGNKKEKLRANIDKQNGIPTENNTLNPSRIDIPKQIILLSVWHVLDEYSFIQNNNIITVNSFVY